MARPTRLESLDDVRLWIADHDGRIDQLWSSQLKWNDKIDLSFLDVNRRLTSLEKRVIYMAGAAAGVGSVAGAVLPYLVGVLGG